MTDIVIKRVIFPNGNILTASKGTQFIARIMDTEEDGAVKFYFYYPQINKFHSATFTYYIDQAKKTRQAESISEEKYLEKNRKKMVREAHNGVMEFWKIYVESAYVHPEDRDLTERMMAYFEMRRNK